METSPYSRPPTGPAELQLALERDIYRRWHAEALRRWHAHYGAATPFPFPPPAPER